MNIAGFGDNSWAKSSKERQWSSKENKVYDEKQV